MANNILNDLLKELAEDKIFSVTFLKNDNTQRHMVCRRDVKKALNPNTKGMSEAQLTNLIQNNILRVYEFQTEAYKSIPCNRILRLKIRGCEIFRENINEEFHINKELQENVTA